ncbi:MAG: hypothetical protein ACOC2E_09600 [Bacteroidota bacterium]
MPSKNIKENLIYKKDIVLQSTSDEELEEKEHLFSKTLFNKNGKTTREIQYDEQGNITQDFEYTYDEKGNLTEKILHDDEGGFGEKVTFEYDQNGKKSREFIHYIDETYDTVVFIRNDDGLTIKKEIIDYDGDTESTEEFEYQGKNLVKHTVKDDAGQTVSVVQVTYDEKGNITEEAEQNLEEGITKIKKVEYFPSGNKKEVLTYTNDDLTGKVTMTEDEKGQIVKIIEETPCQKNTTIMKYDDSGNIVYQEESDRKGKLISHVTRQYDDENKMISSQVFIDGQGRRLSRNYTLRHDYVLHEEK